MPSLLHQVRTFVAVLLLPVIRSDCDSVTIFGLKTADCSRQNSKTIPRTLDGNIQVFRFDENRLAYLSDDEFSRYPNIQELYLARNRIEVISARALQGLFSLQVLDLDGNQLSDVPTNVLSTVPTLRMLRLSGNPIRQIHSGALKSLIHVEELNFENCWLTDIDALAFEGLSKLVEINLVNNELHTLSPNMERHLPRSLNIVRLYRNPWICDCRLRWLRRWTSQAKTSQSQSTINWDFFTNTPACAAPELIRGVAWKHLTPQQFACPSRIIANGNSTATSMRIQPGQNTSLDCIASGDPEPSVEWSKGSTPLPEAFEGTPDLWSVELRVLPATVEGDAGLISSRLNLIHIGAKQAGSYVCTASNSAGRSEVTYKLIVDIYDSARGLVSGGDRSGDGLLIDRETIIGISIAMVVLILLFILCTVVRMKKRNRHRREYKLKDYTDGTTPLKDAADGEVGEGGLRETGEDEKESEEGNYTQIYKDWTSSVDRTTQTLLRDNGGARLKSAVVRNVGGQTQTSEEDLSGARCVVQNGASPNVIYSKCNRNRIGENQHALKNSVAQTLEPTHHSNTESDDMPRETVDAVEVVGESRKGRDCFDPKEMEIGQSSSATSDESEYGQQVNSLDLLSSGYNVCDQDAVQRESVSISDAQSYSENNSREGKRPPRAVSFSADTNKRLKKSEHSVTPGTSTIHDCPKTSNNVISPLNPVAKDESFSSTETLVIDDTISNTGGLLESFQAQQQQRERREQQQWERKEAQMQQREQQLLDRLQQPKRSSGGVDYRTSDDACLDDVCAIPRPAPLPMITIKMVPSAGSKEDRLPPPYHLHARDDNCRQNVAHNVKPALNHRDSPQYSSRSQISVAPSELNDCQRRRLPTIPGQSGGPSQKWDYSRGRTQAAEFQRCNANGKVPPADHSNSNNTYSSLGRVRDTCVSVGEDLISASNRIPSSSSLKYSFPHLHQNRTVSQRPRPTDASSSHRQNQRQVAFPLQRRDEQSSSIRRDSHQPDDLNISRSKATDRSLFGGVRDPPKVHSSAKTKEANQSQKKPLKMNNSDCLILTSNRQSTTEKCPITLLSDILSSPFDGASNNDNRTQAKCTTPEWNSPDFSFDDDNTGTAL